MVNMRIIFVFVLTNFLSFVRGSNHASRNHCSTSANAKLTATLFVKCNPHFDLSNCPQEKWLQVFRDSDAQKGQKEKYKFVNIGFNKGYNFATWLNVFAPSIGVDAANWFKELKTIPTLGESDRCGACEDCRVPPVKPTMLRSGDAIVEPKLHIVGVDINKGNIDTVNTVLAALRRTQRVEDRLTVELVHAAGGSVVPGAPKTLKMPKCDVGNEVCKIPTDKSDSLNASEYEVVRIVGVDELVRELKLIDSHGAKDTPSSGEHSAENVTTIRNNNSTSRASPVYERRGDQRAYSANVVDIVHIDTEGNDPDVIKSAMGLLESHRIRALIFEYHKFAVWSNTNLKDVLESITQHNMECYFMGQNRLWPISGKCWDPQYEFHDWSNVMCILRSDPWHHAIQPLIHTAAALFSKHNGTVARTHGAKEIFYLENGQRHGFNSWDAFVNKGFKNEDIKTVDSCVMNDLFLLGKPIL